MGCAARREAAADRDPLGSAQVAGGRAMASCRPAFYAIANDRSSHYHFKSGDAVIMPFAFSGSTCVFCHDGLQTSCVHGKERALTSARASKSSDKRLHCHLSSVRVLRSALSSKITTGGARGRATATAMRRTVVAQAEACNETKTQRIEKQKQSEVQYSWPPHPHCDCTGSAFLDEQSCLRGR